MKRSNRIRMTTGTLASLALLVFSVFATEPASAQFNDLNAAIDVAGRQRMLTQRIAKYYFQLGVGARGEEAAAGLEKSVGEFGAALVDLKAYAPNQQVMDFLADVESLWQGLLPVLRETPTRESALSVFDRTSFLMLSSDDVVVALAAQSEQQASQLINLAGRQRMLSQRMAALYMLRAWKFVEPRLLEAYSVTEAEFGEAIEVLTQAPETTDSIKSELRKLHRNYKTFVRGAATAGQSVPSVMAHSADRMLEQSQKIVTMYLAIGSGSS